MAKLEERQIYLLFKGAVPELSDEADDLDGESPDVVTTTVTGRRIGIELTGFFHGTAPKGGVSQVQCEQFQRQVVLEAQRRFETNGGIPLHVHVGWYGSVVTDPLERLAQELADQVAAHLPIVPPTETFADVMIENHELPGWTAEWVATVHILRTARGTAHFWGVPQVGYIDADADGLRNRIVDKEQKLPSYRPSDENWLSSIRVTAAWPRPWPCRLRRQTRCTPPPSIASTSSNSAAASGSCARADRRWLGRDHISPRVGSRSHSR